MSWSAFQMCTLHSIGSLPFFCCCNPDKKISDLTCQALLKTNTYLEVHFFFAHSEKAALGMVKCTGSKHITRVFLELSREWYQWFLFYISRYIPIETLYKKSTLLSTMDIYVGCEYTVFFFSFGKKSSNGNAASNFWRKFPFFSKRIGQTLLSTSRPVCLLPTIWMIPYKSVAS